MFWKKPVPAWESVPPETVSCEVCKHVILKTDAQKIKHTPYSGAMWSIPAHMTYYCPEHKRKYDKSYVGYGFSLHFLKEMEVEEDGTPVGYVKKDGTWGTIPENQKGLTCDECGRDKSRHKDSCSKNPTPVARKVSQCGLCQEKGHNALGCPMNKRKKLAYKQNYYLKHRKSTKPYRPYKKI